jgi:hypothetical protein
MKRFLVHTFLLLIVVYLYILPTDKNLIIEENANVLWKEVKQKYYNTLRTEKRVVKYITPRGHL